MDQSEVRHIKKMFDEENVHLREIVRNRWLIGRALHEGDFNLVEVSNTVGRSRSVLSRCRQFYILYPNENLLEDVIKETGSWTQVCRKALPTRARDDDSIEPIASNLEQAAMEAEEFAAYSHSEEVKREMAVAAAASANALLEVSQRLDPDLELSTEVCAPAQWIPGNVYTLTRSQQNMIQALYRTFPCMRCHTEFDITFHHWPLTKGAGGKDWRGLPLCPTCHSYAQENPQEFVETVDIIDWMQDQLAMAFVMLSERK